MNKILLISYYYNFNNVKSTAISMDSRIYGIKDKYKIDIISMINNDNILNSQDYSIFNIHTETEFGSNESIVEFCKKAVQIYSKKPKKYDIVIIHSNTAEMMLIPLKLKAINSRQKIIGYSPDPSINSVLRTRMLKEDYKNLIENEYKFYENCNRVIVTNDLFKKHIIQFHNISEKKIVTIEHSYKEKIISTDETYNFVYIGTTYFGRKIDNLCSAFDKFIALNEENKKYKLIISITNRQYFLENLKNIINIDNFIFVDRISFDKAQKIESSAFVNINITLPIEGNNRDIYFPTKLAQFLSYDRPILTISDNEGVSSRLMSETNNYYAKNSIDEIVDCLIDISQKRKKINIDKYDSYSSSIKGIIFARLIDDLLFEK